MVRYNMMSSWNADMCNVRMQDFSWSSMSLESSCVVESSRGRFARHADILVSGVVGEGDGDGDFGDKWASR